ncbi:GHKL domain-containing protein [Shewanella avicenniae]|uniref:histidine kinase n=1 Tax=Shewanella avicenniae TaxID=2814294 RepID=A0ABX7QUW5_9GAMM|nr:ATP-binding protein [Shewanella avicenniae]QSX34633.1 GHKL domain-containing protein [Shewanella avicenniae]
MSPQPKHPSLSLKSRIVASALLLNLVLLPLIGMALSDAFRVAMTDAEQSEMSAAMYGILALAEVEDDELVLPATLQDKQFNVDQSGLYALVTNPQGEILWRSASLLSMSLPQPLPFPAMGQRQFGEMSFNGTPHFIFSFSAGFSAPTPNDEAFDFAVHIIKTEAALAATQAEFTEKIWHWLFILMAILLLLQAGWLWWTLRPISRFRQELAAVEQGKQQHLNSQYPSELAKVAEQINLLISNEQRQRQRYRNALSDLAHSLKTPLAVLSSIKQLPDEAQEPIHNISANISHQLKRAQSSGNAAWHQGIEVKPIAEKLARTLPKIHRDKPLTISLNIEDNPLFYGEEGDLTELLGNLLDNACKAAKQQVRFSANKRQGELLMVIEDDGPGIAPEQREAIFQRGVRADTYEKGHGVGLAIVKDLLTTYQGSWQIERSQALGGAQFNIHLPK